MTYASNVSGTFSVAREQALLSPATHESIANAPSKDAARAAFLASWDQDEREDLVHAIAAGEVPARETVSAEVFTASVAAYRRKCLMIASGDIGNPDAYGARPCPVAGCDGHHVTTQSGVTIHSDPSLPPDTMRTVIVRSCIDPLERLVDGMSGRACMDTWTAWMRAGDQGPAVPIGQILTPAQQHAARDAWRHELAQLAKTTAQKDRYQVTCDDQYEL
jgi:hypothetical protein